MKLILLLLAISVLAQTKVVPVTPTKTVTPKIVTVVEKTPPVIDTINAILQDTVPVVQYKVTKRIKTYKDTTILVKDTSITTIRLDTLWPKKYTRGLK